MRIPNLIKILFTFLALAFLTSTHFVYNTYTAEAQDTIFSGMENEGETAAQSGITATKEVLADTGITHTESFGDLVIKYVNFILPYLALAAFVGFIYAGFLYVTAYGNDEQLQKAKKILIWVVVGLLLVITSYAITNFLTGQLVEELGSQTSSGQGIRDTTIPAGSYELPENVQLPLTDPSATSRSAEPPFRPGSLRNN